MKTIKFKNEPTITTIEMIRTIGKIKMESLESVHEILTKLFKRELGDSCSLFKNPRKNNKIRRHTHEDKRIKKLIMSALNVPVEVIAEVRSMKNRTSAITSIGTFKTLIINFLIFLG